MNQNSFFFCWWWLVTNVKLFFLRLPLIYFWNWFYRPRFNRLDCSGSTQNPPPRPGKLVSPGPSLARGEEGDRAGLEWCAQARLGPSNEVTALTSRTTSFCQYCVRLRWLVCMTASSTWRPDCVSSRITGSVSSRAWGEWLWLETGILMSCHDVITGG